MLRNSNRRIHDYFIDLVGDSNIPEESSRVLSFAVWVIRAFCPAEFQKYAYLLVGLVVLISVCYLLSGLAGGNLIGTHPIRHLN